MGDSVINHAAGARVPRVADATFPSACTVQRHESTLKPRQHPPYGSNEPLRPTPSLSLFAIPWTDIPDTGNSLVFPRGIAPLRNLAKSVNLIRKASVNLTIFLINKDLTWNDSYCRTILTDKIMKYL